jgi:hypothetical protein
MQTKAHAVADSALETLVAEQAVLLRQLTQEVQGLQQAVTNLQTTVRQQSTLGFSNGRDYTIIERDRNTLWHRFEDDEPVPIKFKILKGYLKQVAFVDKEYPKLHVFLEGDREYVLVTGFETHFSREILAAISSLTPADLAYPLTIKPDIGSGEGEAKGKHKPVFCNVIHKGRTIKHGSLRNLGIQELFQRAEAVIQGQSASPATLPPPAPIDWSQVCRDLNISADQLKALAQTLNLPMGKLTPSQSEQLYQAVYQRHGGDALEPWDGKRIPSQA